MRPRIASGARSPHFRSPVRSGQGLPASKIYRVTTSEGLPASKIYRVTTSEGLPASRIYRVTTSEGLPASKIYRATTSGCLAGKEIPMAPIARSLPASPSRSGRSLLACRQAGARCPAARRARRKRIRGSGGDDEARREARPTCRVSAEPGRISASSSPEAYASPSHSGGGEGGSALVPAYGGSCASIVSGASRCRHPAHCAVQRQGRGDVGSSDPRRALANGKLQAHRPR
jgi:hypothetical protein